MRLPGLRSSLCRLSIAVLIVLTPLLSACGGGGAKQKTKTATEITNTTVSKGQALIDLKKAYDSGAMSYSEYQSERQKVLDAP